MRRYGLNPVKPLWPVAQLDGAFSCGLFMPDAQGRRRDTSGLTSRTDVDLDVVQLGSLVGGGFNSRQVFYRDVLSANRLGKST